MKNFLLLLFFGFTFLQAQYTTPGDGSTVTLSDLILVEPAVVVLSGTDEYTLNADLTISATDTFLIDESVVLKINPDILITVFGNFITQSSGPDAEPLLITAQDQASPYNGFRFEEGSLISLNNTIFEYGGGMRVLTEQFFMNQCTVRFMSEGQATGGALSFSGGRPMIEYSHFYMNDLPAIASGANQTVSARIFNNTFEMNGQANENRPQINLSASGAQDSIYIENNIITGDRSREMVGGIAIANFFGSPNNVVIRGNTITDNRYGLALMGANNYALIDDNVIENNNSQNEPMQGGSGINLYSTGDAVNTNTIISNNLISGNLWGITLQGNAWANMGDGTEQSTGGNIFSDNGNNGAVYALYNNTANHISAQNNCWISGQESTAEQVEDVIFHQPDQMSLGLVDFTGFNCNLAVNDVEQSNDVSIYPNPAKDLVNIISEESGTFEIYNSAGQSVSKQAITAGENRISLNLKSGMYFMKINTSGKTIHKKLLIK